MDPKEFAIQSAIADLESGVFTSRRKAAERYGIAESTLRGRQQGQQPHAIAHQPQQRLTLEQEDFLVDWILEDFICSGGSIALAAATLKMRAATKR